MRLIAIPPRGSALAPEVAAESDPVVQTLNATWDLYDRRGYEPPWTGYFGVEDGICVGTCAFTGPPVDGEVEIAYFSFPGFEGRGVATRMAAELLRVQAASTRDLLVCIAHTLPEEGPSTTILKKLGFALASAIDHPEDGSVWKWRLLPGALADAQLDP